MFKLNSDPNDKRKKKFLDYLYTQNIIDSVYQLKYLGRLLLKK